MSVVFSEARNLPAEFSGEAMGSYGADGTFTEAGAIGILKAASPWDMLTGLFVDKPRAEAAAQAAVAEAQSMALQQQAISRAKTMKTAILAGAGILGVLVLATVMRPAPQRAVAGYSRKARRAPRKGSRR